MTTVRNILPLIVLALATCIPSGSFAQKFVTYHGNKFELSERVDTITLTDPVTNTEVQKVISDISIPKKINGQRIYWDLEITTQPKPVGKNPPLNIFLLKKLSKQLGKLPDGVYNFEFNSVVINTKGVLVYYRFNGIHGINDVPDKLQKEIKTAVDKILSTPPAMIPGKLNGKPVNVFISHFGDEQTLRIEIKDHKLIHLE